MKHILGLFALAGALAADSTVQGPRLGYVSSASGIRPVLGLVGSSRLSDAVAKDLRQSVVLPGSDYAVGLDAQGMLVRVHLGDGTSHSLGISDTQRLLVSPAGEAILAISADAKVTVISPAGSRLAEFVLPAAPILAAVADPGTMAAITVSEPDGEALYLVDAGSSRRVFRTSRIAAAAFLAGSKDLIFADGSGSIYRLNADLQLTELGRAEGAVALAADSAKVLAVAGSVIHVWRQATGVWSTIECPCAGKTASPLGGSRFLLTNPGEGLMWMLDASTDELRIAFIPEAINE